THRGPHPEDTRLFAPEQLPTLRQAVSHLAWLLERGYSDRAASTLVGDRFRLTERQRMAVFRSVCSDSALARRREHEVWDVRGQVLAVDGFNVLITVEAALSGGILLRGRDGCLRDLASMHGSYRKVEETERAVRALGDLLADLGPSRCLWYLDSPVSNSGRLKMLLLSQPYGWEVETVPDPDRILADTEHVVASSDRVVLDRCRRWFNLSARAVDRLGAPVLDLGLRLP
ncbi:MAG: DUF434 domain-containing protein, partial [Candidatus Eremiobacterota bacterium]